MEISDMLSNTQTGLLVGIAMPVFWNQQNPVRVKFPVGSKESMRPKHAPPLLYAKEAFLVATLLKVCPVNCELLLRYFFTKGFFYK